MKIIRSKYLQAILAFVLGASLFVVACKKDDDDDKKTVTEGVVPAATLTIQLSAACDGSPCI